MYPNTLKIHTVCVTIFLPTLFQLFYLFILFCFKKPEIRVQPGHLQQIEKKIMGLSFSVKLHLYLTGNTLIHYGYFFYFPFLIAGRNLVTKTDLQGLKLRKYFRGQVGPHQINFGSPHNLLGAHQARIVRLPPRLQGALRRGVR